MEEIGVVLEDRLSEKALVSELLTMGAIRESPPFGGNSYWFPHSNDESLGIEVAFRTTDESWEEVFRWAGDAPIRDGLTIGTVLSLRFMDRNTEIDEVLWGIIRPLTSKHGGVVEVAGKYWTLIEIEMSRAQGNPFPWRIAMEEAARDAFERLTSDLAKHPI